MCAWLEYWAWARDTPMTLPRPTPLTKYTTATFSHITPAQLDMLPPLLMRHFAQPRLGRPRTFFFPPYKTSLRDLETVHKVGGLTKTGRGDIAELLVVKHDSLAGDA